MISQNDWTLTSPVYKQAEMLFIYKELMFLRAQNGKKFKKLISQFDYTHYEKCYVSQVGRKVVTGMHKTKIIAGNKMHSITSTHEFQELHKLIWITLR